MIYVLNLNPSLDYHMALDHLSIGQTNRSVNEDLKIGGKGTNVAVVLNNLKIESTVLGFVGGFTGTYLRAALKKYPYIMDAMIETEITTRINVKVKTDVDTELNSSGGVVSTPYQAQLKEQLNQVSDKDLVVISGKLPRGMSESWYHEVCASLSERNIPFVLDIATPILLDLCKFKPLLIKPNRSELALIFNDSNIDVERCGYKLIGAGATNCIISLGSDGSQLFTKTDTYFSEPISAKLINPVGAGDSMVAGFIAANSQGMNSVDSYRMACACAAASIFSSSLCDEHTLYQYYDSVKIKTI